MEVPVDIHSARIPARTDTTIMPDLLNTLSMFALMIGSALLSIALATATDMPYTDEFLYGRGHECILPLMFLVVSALIFGLYIGALTLEPMLLPAWEQSVRVMRVVRTFLLRNLWVLVRRIGILCSAFLIGARFPYREPDEVTGLWRIAAPDTSPRSIHRWLPGTSPPLVYH